MDEVLAIILKDTYTLTQLKHRIRLLKSTLLKTFFGGEDETIPPPDLIWLKSLDAKFYSQFNKDNVYRIFEGLEETVTKLPTLVIYLTFEPGDDTISQLGLSARQTFNLPNLLLDVRFDPGLIAGAALSWKGIYRDYSLRTNIDSKKAEILQEFKKFLR